LAAASAVRQSLTILRSFIEAPFRAAKYCFVRRKSSFLIMKLSGSAKSSAEPTNFQPNFESKVLEINH
jgi:hypothetical protein